MIKKLNMNSIKKIMGFFWMILAPVVIYLLIKAAIQNIDSTGTKDINKPVPWIIIITIFTPIAKHTNPKPKAEIA